MDWRNLYLPCLFLRWVWDVGMNLKTQKVLFGSDSQSLWPVSQGRALTYSSSEGCTVWDMEGHREASKPPPPIYTQHRLSDFLVNECGNILKTMTADSAFHYITLQREKGLCCRASSLWLVGTNALGKVDYRENVWVLSCLSQQNQNWGGHMPSRYVLPSLHDLRDSPKPYHTVSQYHHPGEHAFTTWTFGEHLAPML